MRLSVISSAFVAAIVGFGGTVAVILAAAAKVGATSAEAASWVCALCIAVGISSTVLSVRHRMPLVASWSLPGAALLASFGGGIGMPAAVGAFIFAGALAVLCGALRPLGLLVARIPVGVAGAMLAGVLVRFVMALGDLAVGSPWLVLPLILIYLVVRLYSPSGAVLAALGAGLVAGLALAPAGSLDVPFTLSRLVWIWPEFDLATLISVGVPLFLVTMASQNLPGFAVLRACGYEPPVRSILTVTGAVSMATAPLGAHASNLAAITAAICTGPDAHPDPHRRWLTGPLYGGFYFLFAALGAWLVGIFAALPATLVATVAGLALLSPLTGALTAAMSDEPHRTAAVATFATTASGVSALGLGAPVWGLAVGLAIVALDAVAHWFGIGGRPRRRNLK